jgi:hypothetical protein
MLGLKLIRLVQRIRAMVRAHAARRRYAIGGEVITSARLFVVAHRGGTVG